MNYQNVGVKHSKNVKLFILKKIKKALKKFKKFT